MRFLAEILDFECFGFGSGEAISDLLSFLLYILECLPGRMGFLAAALGGFFVLLRNKAEGDSRLLIAPESCK